MTEFVVAIGSNIEPAVHVPSGIDDLRQRFTVEAISPFYVTPAIDRPEQPDYWNGVVLAVADVGQAEVGLRLREIEAAHGRVRGPDKWAARTLDLDILMWADSWHPDVHGRPFLALAVHDVGRPPPDVPLPESAWPVAWKAQP